MKTLSLVFPHSKEVFSLNRPLLTRATEQSQLGELIGSNLIERLTEEEISINLTPLIPLPPPLLRQWLQELEADTSPEATQIQSAIRQRLGSTQKPLIRLKYPAKCFKCDYRLALGTMAVYDKENKKVSCPTC